MYDRVNIYTYHNQLIIKNLIKTNNDCFLIKKECEKILQNYKTIKITFIKSFSCLSNLIIYFKELKKHNINIEIDYYDDRLYNIFLNLIN